MKRIIILLLVLCFVFSSCNFSPASRKNEKSEINIKIYVFDEMKDIIQSQIQNIEINAHDKSLIINTVENEEESDIFIFERKKYKEKKKTLLKISKDETEIKTRNIYSSYNSVMQDGKLYAYPIALKSYFLFYDEMIYNQDEVKSLEKMMFKDIGKGRKNFAFDVSDISVLSSFFAVNGLNIFENKFDSQSASSPVEYLIRLFSNEKFENYNLEEALNEFKKGNLGAIISNIENFTKIKEALKDNFSFDALPSVSLNGKDIKLISYTAGIYLGINKKTEFPVIAMDICNYLTNEDIQLKLAERLYGPTNRKLLESETANGKFLKVSCEQIANSAELPEIAFDKNLSEYYSAFSNQIYSGIITKSNMIEKIEEFKRKNR